VVLSIREEELTGFRKKRRSGKWRKTDGWADAAVNQQPGFLTSSLTGSKDLRRICLKLNHFRYERRLNHRKREKG